MSAAETRYTDRVIRRCIEILLLAMTSFGLPVAVAVACLQPSLNEFMDYNRDAAHLFGYEIGFNILDFAKTLPAATFIGLVAWFAPMLVITNALRSYVQAPLSIAVLSVILALADLYIISGYPRGFNDSYNYIIGAFVFLGAWIAGNYLHSHPINICEN